MIDAALIVWRFAQYGAASILMGASLFVLYALPPTGSHSAAELRWPRLLVLAAGAGLLVSSILGLVTQTATMAGSLAEALKPASLEAVVGGMDLGKAAIVRAVAAGLAVVVLLPRRPGRFRWVSVSLLGSVAAASMAWMGHGATTEGEGQLPHLVADILHCWAAAAWIGALCAFVILLRTRSSSAEALLTSHRALRRFSTIGTLLVATLVATGLVNSWFLVGIDNVDRLLATDYGQLLALKLALFAAMLALASANRFRFTPALETTLAGRSAGPNAVRTLRRSIVVEAMLGFGILALVAWFGTLPPPSGA